MSQIMVACKFPNGLLLRLHREVDDVTPLFGGGVRNIKRWEETGEQVMINGPGHPLVPRPDQDPNIYGYALTSIDEDFWEAWKAQNQDNEMLRKGILFAHEKPEDVRAQAKEQHGDGVKSGMEPIDPENPPVAGTRLGKLKVTVADEQPRIKQRDPDEPRQRPTRVKRA